MSPAKAPKSGRLLTWTVFSRQQHSECAQAGDIVSGRDNTTFYHGGWCGKGSSDARISLRFKIQIFGRNV